jgi:hypothetical protein
LECGRLSSRGTGFAEILGGGSFSVAAVVADSLIGDQPGKGYDPARGMTNTLNKNKNRQFSL